MSTGPRDAECSLENHTDSPQVGKPGPPLPHLEQGKAQLGLPGLRREPEGGLQSLQGGAVSPSRTQTSLNLSCSLVTGAQLTTHLKG